MNSRRTRYLAVGQVNLIIPSASEDVDVHLTMGIFFASYRLNGIPYPCDDMRSSY